VIHVWPYKDLEERARIRAAAVKDGAWPPKIAEFVLAQRAEIMVPFPFSPELKPGRMGPCFEMRTYTVPAGELPKVMKLWEQVLPERVKLSPLAAVWHAELGGLNRFTHIWAYPSLDSRSETRKKAVASGVWPPSAVAKKQGLEGYRLLAQENKIVMPAPFSPLH
jgi:hypothetical protein